MQFWIIDVLDLEPSQNLYSARLNSLRIQKLNTSKTRLSDLVKEGLKRLAWDYSPCYAHSLSLYQFYYS